MHSNLFVQSQASNRTMWPSNNRLYRIHQQSESYIGSWLHWPQVMMDHARIWPVQYNFCTIYLLIWWWISLPSGLLGHRYKTVTLSEPPMLCFGSEILHVKIYFWTNKSIYIQKTFMFFKVIPSPNNEGSHINNFINIHMAFLINTNWHPLWLWIHDSVPCQLYNINPEQIHRKLNSINRNQRPHRLDDSW
jgi:hypothetical protein